MSERKPLKETPHRLDELDALSAGFKRPSASQAVADYLVNVVLSGVIRPGEKLPPERLLAQNLGVSRSVLRSALKALMSMKLIRSTQGGGNYVNEIIGAQMTDPIAPLLRESPKAMDDFMEFRCEFEGSIVSLAASRATSEDKKALTLIFQRMQAAHDAGDTRSEAMLDADFHMAIADASHNFVFIHIAQALRKLMQQELLNTRLVLFDEDSGENGQKQREIVLEQHEQILRGIIRQNSSEAIAAMQGHIRYVRERLRECSAKAERNMIARERLRQWAVRLPPESEG